MKKFVEGVSSFKGLCTALAGCIGTGNIARVATSIAWGTKCGVYSNKSW